MGECGNSVLVRFALFSFGLWRLQNGRDTWRYVHCFIILIYNLQKGIWWWKIALKVGYCVLLNTLLLISSSHNIAYVQQNPLWGHNFITINNQCILHNCTLLSFQISNASGIDFSALYIKFDKSVRLEFHVSPGMSVMNCYIEKDSTNLICSDRCLEWYPLREN